jgi:predicted amidophosphoribosyltransferase
MVTPDILTKLEEELLLCKHCQRNFREKSNKGLRTCDGCGAELPRLSRDLFMEIMNDSNWFPEVSLGLEMGGSKLRRAIYGLPFAGFK